MGSGVSYGPILGRSHNDVRVPTTARALPFPLPPSVFPTPAPSTGATDGTTTHSQELVDLLAGVGGLVLGVVTVGVLLWEFVNKRRLQRAASDREKSDQEKDARSHADGLTWWITSMTDRRVAEAGELKLLPLYTIQEPPHSREMESPETIAVGVQNASTSPFFRARLFRADETDENVRELGIGVIPPGLSKCEIVTWLPPVRRILFRMPSHYAFSDGIVECIEFTDRHGARWRRYGDGRLQRMAGDGAEVSALRYLQW